jgi:hypothetical protein
MHLKDGVHVDVFSDMYQDKQVNMYEQDNYNESFHPKYIVHCSRSVP